MDKKSFFWGVLAGAALMFVITLVIGLINQKSSESDDPIEYLEQPVSYENKVESSFKVIQVLGDAALAMEASIGEFYMGNTVLILGEGFYTGQEVTVKNPQRVGVYSYTTNKGMPMTVPVIEGEITE